MAELDATPSLSVHIRDRHLRDIPDLVRMLREGFPGWYRRLPYLLFPTIVAEHDGRAVGFVSMPLRNSVGEIGLIAVDALQFCPLAQDNRDYLVSPCDRKQQTNNH